MYVSSMYVSSMIERQGDMDVVCRGRVLLHMRDTVWLDRCQLMVRHPNLAKFVCTFKTVSCRHMDLMYMMVEKAGIPIPELREESLHTSIVEEWVEVKS